MKIRTIGLVAALFIAAAAVSAPQVAAAPPHGISGHVTIKPVSPLGSASAPYAATIVVTGHSRSWTVASNAAGDFTLSVPPGTYTVRGTSAHLLPRAPRPVSVTVGAHGWTAVSLVYDSGIR